MRKVLEPLEPNRMHPGTSRTLEPLSRLPDEEVDKLGRRVVHLHVELFRRDRSGSCRTRPPESRRRARARSRRALPRYRPTRRRYHRISLLAIPWNALMTRRPFRAVRRTAPSIRWSPVPTRLFQIRGVRPPRAEWSGARCPASSRSAAAAFLLKLIFLQPGQHDLRQVAVPVVLRR